MFTQPRTTGSVRWIALVIVVLGLIGIIYLAKSAPAPDNSQNVTVRTDDHVFGKATAPVLLVEYGDYQCPACASYHPLVKQLTEEFPDTLRFVFRNFTLAQHQWAFSAAESAEAAALQNKFWEMHNKIYETQALWATSTDAGAIFVGFAGELGLNVEQFKQDLRSATVTAKIADDMKIVNTLALNHTPTFFLNGKEINPPTSYEGFKKLITDAAAGTTSTTDTATATPAYHAHADFLMVLNGKTIDLSLPQFQSVEGKELDQYVHLHNNNGKIIHLHKEGITLGDFLNSIGYKVSPLNTSRSFVTDPNGTKYTGGGTVQFQMLVNGKQADTASIFSYKIHDLDRIYLRFGESVSEDTLKTESLAKLSNDACIYSETCPERGPAPEEECVGGLGTTCDVQKK